MAWPCRAGQRGLAQLCLVVTPGRLRWQPRSSVALPWEAVVDTTTEHINIPKR